MSENFMERQQEAIAQALEMYKRAQQNKGSQTAPPPKKSTTKARAKKEPMSRNMPAADMEQDDFEIPATDQGNLSEQLSDTPEGDEVDDSDIFMDINQLRKTEYPKRDTMEPFDWELEEDDFLAEPPQSSTPAGEEPAMPASSNRVESQADHFEDDMEEDFPPAPDISFRNAVRGPTGRTNNSTGQQYYQNTGPAGRRTPSGHYKKDPRGWTNTDGYTDQYYEDEITYEEISTGQNGNTLYGDTADIVIEQPGEGDAPPLFDDTTILLLLLSTLLEENKHPDLITLLLYVLG